jgi:FKBP-type peptidyl-prolyl cis-trans isomerase
MRFFAMLAIGLLLISCQNNAQDKVELNSRKDSVSYAIGYSIGQNFKMQEIDVDPVIVSAAIADVMGEKDALLTDEQAQQIWMSYQGEMMQAQQKKREEQAKTNKEEGAKFLAENAKKEGVVTTESGLQYKVIKMGDGPKPAPTDQVKCNYKGTLLDGTVFDSSYDRGEPATFPLNGVIKGWTEVLQLMPVGSTFEAYIPGDLAYGERGAGAKIGPNATLIFTIELLEIVKK